MCGIWALFGSQVSKPVITNAFEKISYRGPDSSKLESLSNYSNCYLGFHRLAILDPDHGMQPMRLAKYPHIWLICNGEIYNHKELAKEFGLDCQTQSDVEIIIHLYLTEGITSTVKQLDGTFAFCLVDTEKGNIYIGRDTFGIKPVFRLQKDNGYLGICSEGKGLIGLSKGKCQESIEQLLPGHVETYSLNADGLTRFEDRMCVCRIGEFPGYKSRINYLDNKSVEMNIRTLFEAAVTKRMTAERRIGCLLSGGLDSSLITSLVCKVAKKLNLPYQIQTFSIGLEGSKDLQAARKVAEFLNTEHHEIVISPEEGTAVMPDIIYHLESYDMCNIRASIGMYLMCKYIKDKTDSVVIMSGEGADGIAQGYSKFYKAPSASVADIESRRQCENLYMFDVLRADRLSAAFGLEIRLPFLDHEFSSYYLSLPNELRNPQNGIEKYTLRSAFNNNVNILPHEILWRPKECFVDGVSSDSISLCKWLEEFTDKQFDESEFQNEALKFKTNLPPTKQALYYRLIFEKMYKDQGYWLPYFWDSK